MIKLKSIGVTIGVNSVEDKIKLVHSPLYFTVENSLFLHVMIDKSTLLFK